MFEQLYEHPYVLSRHQNGPLLADRRRFLVYLAQRGASRSSLRSFASLLLRMIDGLDLANYPAVGSAIMWPPSRRLRCAAHENQTNAT